MYKCHAISNFYGWDQVDRGPIDWTNGPLPEYHHDIHGLIVTPKLPVTKQLLNGMPNLMVISAYGAGYDYIDVEAASALGILVTHTPDAVVEATAELGLGLILASVRHIVTQDRAIRKATSKSKRVQFPRPIMSHDGSSRVIGLIGYGRIGQRLGQWLAELNIPYIYNRRRGPLDTHPGYRPLDTLLNEADVVVLLTPLTSHTYHLINARTLAQMKPTAILVNISRGACVDESALIAALEQGTIAGAALDVFEDEPWIPEALVNMDNVVLSPHAGTQTWETRLAMTRDAVGNVVATLAGNPRNMVNPDRWSRRPH